MPPEIDFQLTLILDNSYGYGDMETYKRFNCCEHVTQTSLYFFSFLSSYNISHLTSVLHPCYDLQQILHGK